MEKSRITVDGEHTIVLYLFDKRIKLYAKTRSGVVAALIRSDAQVFGACAPVNKKVIQAIRDLDGKNLSRSTINQLTRRNKKYTPFRFSRDYRMIIKWLNFEYEGKRIDKSTFRRELRAGRLSVK
ncbi:MAG TPA: hypothetical protein VEG28_02810 [Dehalococcoidia bacterium]|nr:hypothetical protein [Dehalococcoidia bacterium]